MARKRLTSETLDTVQKVSDARTHVRLAERLLGPAATDSEILDTAEKLASIPAEQARKLYARSAAIEKQTRRLKAGPDGAADPWDESGPEQPDPTNNQAYTKTIFETPDHAVLDSLQKQSIHRPTASRASELSAATRKKYRLAHDNPDHAEHKDIKRNTENILDQSEDIHDEGRHIMDEGESILDDLSHEEGEEGMLEGSMDEEGMDEMDEMEEMEGPDDMEDDGMEDHLHKHEGLDLESDEGDLDDMFGMEDEGMDEEGDDEAPDIFDDVDMEDEDEDDDGLEDMGGEDIDDLGEEDIPNRHHEDVPPVPTSSRRRTPQRRQTTPQKTTKKGSRKTSSVAEGPTRVSLDEILSIHDGDIERTASSSMEGDDLEALLGARVDRAGNRIETPAHMRVQSSTVSRRRAMLENIWDTENDPELVKSRGRKPVQAKKKQRFAEQETEENFEDEFEDDDSDIESSVDEESEEPPRRTYASQPGPKRRQAARRRSPSQTPPDRRRGSVRRNSNVNEFDDVFCRDMQDVSKFFD